MADKSAIDELRQAAALIRERAQAATPGPWESLDNGDRLVAWKLDPSGQFDDDFDYVVDEPMSNAANAEHIAAWHPAVALVVADWLDLTVDRWGALNSVRHCERALAVARAYLGTADREEADRG